MRASPVSPAAARKLIQGAGGNQLSDCSGREAQLPLYYNSLAPASGIRARQFCALYGDRRGGHAQDRRARIIGRQRSDASVATKSGRSSSNPFQDCAVTSSPSSTGIFDVRQNVRCDLS